MTKRSRSLVAERRSLRAPHRGHHALFTGAASSITLSDSSLRRFAPRFYCSSLRSSLVAQRRSVAMTLAAPLLVDRYSLRSSGRSLFAIRCSLTCRSTRNSFYCHLHSNPCRLSPGFPTKPPELSASLPLSLPSALCQHS